MKILKSTSTIVVSCILTCFLYFCIGCIVYLIHLTFQFSAHWDQLKISLTRDLFIGGNISAILASFITGLIAARLAPFSKVIHSLLVAVINGGIFLYVIYFLTLSKETLVLPLLLTILVIISTIFGGYTMNHFQMKRLKTLH